MALMEIDEYKKEKPENDAGSLAVERFLKRLKIDSLVHMTKPTRSDYFNPKPRVILNQSLEQLLRTRPEMTDRILAFCNEHGPINNSDEGLEHLRYYLEIAPALDEGAL